jgi:hypothetical protein
LQEGSRQGAGYGRNSRPNRGAASSFSLPATSRPLRCLHFLISGFCRCPCVCSLFLSLRFSHLHCRWFGNALAPLFFSAVGGLGGLPPNIEMPALSRWQSQCTLEDFHSAAQVKSSCDLQNQSPYSDKVINHYRILRAVEKGFCFLASRTLRRLDTDF